MLFQVWEKREQDLHWDPVMGKKEDMQAETKNNKWFIFSLVAVGIFMSTLDSSIVNLALPVIMQDLETSMAAIGWVMMIYLLTVSSLLLGFGRLSDIRGRKWVFVRGVIVFTAGSVFCGLSETALVLIASRGIQGIGAAMIMSATPAVVIDIFPVQQRGKALGTVGAVVACGLTIGPALGGWLLRFFPWPVIFYINIPIGIVTAFLAQKFLTGTNADIRRDESYDLLGAFFLVLSISGFLISITLGREWGYTDIRTLSFLGMSMVSLAILILVENRVSHPVLRPELFRIRQFLFPVVSAMILFSGLFTIIFLMPFYLMNPKGLSEPAAGWVMITPFLFLLTVSPLSGMLYDRVGSRWLTTIGMGILCLGLYLLSTLKPAATIYEILSCMAIVGFGTAMFTAPNNAMVMSAVPPRFRGFASGLVATVRNLGMVMGIALASGVFNHMYAKTSGGMEFSEYSLHAEKPFMAGFRYAMLSGALIAGIGIIASFLRGKDIPGAGS